MYHQAQQSAAYNNAMQLPMPNATNNTNTSANSYHYDYTSSPSNTALLPSNALVGSHGLSHLAGAHTTASTAAATSSLLYHPQQQQQYMQQQQQQQQQHIYHGPFASMEYANTLVKILSTAGNSLLAKSGGHGSSSSGSNHHQVQAQRYQLSGQSSAPHFHARQAAQAARSSATTTTTTSSRDPASKTLSMTSLLNDDGSDLVNPSIPVTMVKRGIAIVDPSTTAPGMVQQQDQSQGVGSNPSVATMTASNTATASSASKDNTNNPYLSHVKMAQQLSPEMWSILDMGGMLIQSLNAAKHLFSTYAFLTALYLNHNHLTTLPASVKDLKQLMVLDLSGNRLRWLPAEMGELRQLKELWLFDNYLETLPWEMAWLRSLDFLGLEGNPMMKLNPMYNASINSSSSQQSLDQQLDMVMKSMRYENPMAEVLYREGVQPAMAWLRDNMPLDVMLPTTISRRKWIRKAQVTDATPTTILSYNILCERYASQQHYWYTPLWALSWHYRRERIYRELMEQDAEILCLQEMDWAQYEDWWKPRLCSPEEGRPVYESAFCPKSRFRTMSERMKKAPGGGVDGCATFWRKDRFRQVGGNMVVEFSQLALGRSDFEKNDTMFERFCSKDNIALGVVLEHLQRPSTPTSGGQKHFRFLLTNAHIHWDPLQTDVKLVQTVMLMEEIGKFSQKFLAEHPDSIRHGKTLPTVICGDFNSLPGSLVYDFLSNPGGIRDVGLHKDLVECFASTEDPTDKDTKPPAATRLLGSVSSLNPEEGASVRRWPSWRESGYGAIAKLETLKHALSGSLSSAYSGVEGVAVEGENVYIPPAHVLSSASTETKRKPPMYPVPALPFTNHTANFSGVIDYIWYTTDDFEVEGVLGGYFYRSDIGRDMVRWIREGQLNEERPSAHPKYLLDCHEHHPSISLVGSSHPTTLSDSLLMGDQVWSVQGSKMLGFPNPAFPSDHIPVVCELVFKEVQGGGQRGRGR